MGRESVVVAVVNCTVFIVQVRDIIQPNELVPIVSTMLCHNKHVISHYVTPEHFLEIEI